jgi:hypothetical protein
MVLVARGVIGQKGGVWSQIPVSCHVMVNLREKLRNMKVKNLLLTFFVPIIIFS